MTLTGQSAVLAAEFRYTVVPNVAGLRMRHYVPHETYQTAWQHIQADRKFRQLKLWYQAQIQMAELKVLIFDH